jgi:hypothetical protein
MKSFKTVFKKVFVFLKMILDFLEGVDYNPPASRPPVED